MPRRDLRRSAAPRLAFDLLFSARLAGGRGDVLLYVLFEHKSRSDPMAAFQMLRYVVRIQERHVRDHPGAALPPVLPILFHHGRAPWRAPTEARDLVDFGDLPAPVAAFLRDHQPGLRIVLDDIAAQTHDGLSSRGLSAIAFVAVLFLRHLHRARLEQLARHLREWRDLLAQLHHQPRGTELLAALSFYAMATTRAAPERVRDVLHRELDSRTATTMSNPLVKLIQKSKAEGRSEGRAELLLEQLRARFGRLPKSAIERVQNASADELKAIARAVLAARTLAEALGE